MPLEIEANPVTYKARIMPTTLTVGWHDLQVLIYAVSYLFSAANLDNNLGQTSLQRAPTSMLLFVTLEFFSM